MASQRNANGDWQTLPYDFRNGAIVKIARAKIANDKTFDPAQILKNQWVIQAILHAKPGSRCLRDRIGGIALHPQLHGNIICIIAGWRMDDKKRHHAHDKQHGNCSQDSIGYKAQHSFQFASSACLILSNANSNIVVFPAKAGVMDFGEVWHVRALVLQMNLNPPPA